MDEIVQADDEASGSLNPGQVQEESHERFNPLTETAPNYSSSALYHLPSLCHLVVSCIALVFFTSGLVITSFPYLQAINGPSDPYSGLLAILCFSFFPLMMALYLRVTLLHRESFIWPESVLYIVKLGCLFGLSFLMVVYAIDDMKVLCHIQEPLMGLVIIYLIVIYFVYKGPELSPMKMFCMCGLLGSLFLSVDYQLNDIYTCRGKFRNTAADDGGDWSEEAHTLWMIVYAIGLFCFTLTFLLLEKEIIIKKNESMSSRINRPSLSNNAEAGDMEALLDSSYEGVPEMGFEGRPLSGPSYGSIIARWDTHTFLLLASTYIFIVAMFWTDFIPTIGKASSLEELFSHVVQAFLCQFSLSDECGVIWLYGWLFILSNIGFYVSLGYVFANSGSMVFAISVSSLSLPISSIFWTIFQIGGTNGVTFLPKVSGQLIFSSLGLPLMTACIIYWIHIDRKQKAETSRVLVV